MKIEREVKGFEKVTLVLETQEELDWLYAISNTAVVEARRLSLGLGITLNGDPSVPQMALYNALSNLYTK
jgi:hypothetical protein